MMVKLSKSATRLDFYEMRNHYMYMSIHQNLIETNRYKKISIIYIIYMNM
jgi:hypothetical protein